MEIVIFILLCVALVGTPVLLFAIANSNANTVNTNPSPTHQKPPIPLPGSPKEYKLSEPVISFIKTIENDPKRFLLKQLPLRTFHALEYKLLDSKTKEIFHFLFSDGRRSYIDSEPYIRGYDDNISFLTEDEGKYLGDYLKRYLDGEQLRKETERNLRERSRLTAIYKD